jgi:hypothetical protein
MQGSTFSDGLSDPMLVRGDSEKCCNGVEVGFDFQDSTLTSA